MSSRRALPWCLALAGTYIGALVALTAPAWFQPGRAIGHADSDVWKHLWGDAWLMRDLGQAWPVPLETEMLWFPDGGLLYNLDPITGFLACLLAPLLGLVTAHNAIQGACLVGGAIAAYLLARRLTGDAAVSAVAGAVYGFSAHLQGAVLASGIGEAAHVAWMPLAVLALLEVLEKPGWWRTLPLGLCLFLSALASWYYGLVAGLACTVVVVAWAAPRLRSEPRALAAPLTRALLGAGLGILLILPFASAFVASLDPSTTLHGSQGAEVALEDLLPSGSVAVASLADFLAPGYRVQTTADMLFFSSHVGFVPATLALFALLTGQRRAGLLGLAALLAAAICLGPVIHFDRDTALVTNPVFAAMGALVPRFELVRNLERVQVALTLCLALLAALGLKSLLGAFPMERRWRLGVGLTVALLVVAEANLSSGLGLPLPTADAEVPPVYGALAQDDAGAILELPAHDGPGGLPFWYQVQHGSPLPMNLDNSPAPALRGNHLLAALMPGPAFARYFRRSRMGEPTDEELERGRLALLEQGYTHAVLTDGRVGEQLYDHVQDVLGACCGEPIAEDPDRGISIYRLSR